MTTLTHQLSAAKQCVWSFMQALPGGDIGAACKTGLTRDVQWVASHPIDELRGPEAVADTYFAPLARALPDAERRCDIFFGGHWDGRIDGGAGCWITATGHIVGTLREPLWGIPAHGELVWLRLGEFYRVVEGRIAEARVLLDLVGLARQVGRPVLPVSTGSDIVVPGPRGHDGLLLHTSEAGSADNACLALVESMIQGLGRFDRNELASMGMRKFWQPTMMWYGPSGIGTSRGIDGFERHHQRPFLAAIPDRKGGHHRARFGEGAYAASTGWPSIHATQTGPYLGEPPSNRPVTMRVMDWWRAEDGLLAENWVLIDLPNFFLQMGVDILARARR
jgi:hypothetical protein